MCKRSLILLGGLVILLLGVAAVPDLAPNLYTLLFFNETDTYVTPVTDRGVLYVKTNHILYFKNNVGTEYDLLTGGGGGVTNAVSTIQTNGADVANQVVKLNFIGPLLSTNMGSGVVDIAGISGTNGVNGTNGLSGTNGVNGTSGTNGVNGATGPAGMGYVSTNVAYAATLSVECSTNLLLFITNACTGNVSIYFTNVVDGVTVFVQALADGTARTMSFFYPAGYSPILWHTNATINATNLYLVASKYGIAGVRFSSGLGTAALATGGSQ